MRTITLLIAASAFACTAVAAASAQDPSSQNTVEEIEVPRACRSAQAGNMPGMMGMGGMQQGNMMRHQQGMMRGMERTMGPMFRGMMAQDPDIAFACAMIPHHQGAIDMAQVQLQEGKDEELRKMAQKLIDDQTREIKDLQSWIESHAAKSQ
jgi:uncharacterized protein (DUF305 family)